MSDSFEWPGGARAATIVTVNLDGESVERGEGNAGLLWGRHSYGRYGVQAGVYRLLELFSKFSLKTTFFVPGWDAESYPTLCETIVDAGHDVGGHGYLHEDFSALTSAEQGDALDRSEAAFERAFGRRPTGWRAPYGLMSSATRGLLIERGYRYDSSYCDDDVPYIVQNASGERLVELPVFGPMGDRHYYSLRRAPDVVAQGWREEFDAMVAAGGLFNLHLRPRGDFGSGRAVRVQAVETILRHIGQSTDIWVTTADEMAHWALESLPITVTVD